MGTQHRVQRRKAATRERLVRSASALFAKHGIYSTTVEDITEAADVGKGTFYEQFPSKTAIIRHLLHEGFEDLLEECRRQVHAAATPKERVELLLRAQFRFFTTRRPLLILFHQVRGLLKLQPDHGRPLQREYERYVRFLNEELGAALDHERYSQAELNRMACAMAGYVTGYLSYLVITGMKKEGFKDLDIPTQLFLDGLVGNRRLDGRARGGPP